jgi:ligand-binding sensor domain-containing protein
MYLRPVFLLAFSFWLCPGIGQMPSSPNVDPRDPLFFIEGQLCQHLRRIYQDTKGNLWFGTNVYEIMRYDGDSLVYFSKESGVNGGRVTAIVEDSDQNVWFGSYMGLFKYDGQKFTQYLEHDIPFVNDIWSVLIDRNGQFWLGTNNGVRQFVDGNFIPFPIPKAAVKDTTTVFAEDRVICILEDKHGTLWFGTDGFGICRFDYKSFSHFTKENGLPDNTVRELLEDKQGNIWIATMFGGVSMYDGNTFTNFTETGAIQGEEAGGFFQDKNGDIWFAVENQGVYRYDGHSFTNYYKDANLPTNGILSIYKDREERFWFGGWGGLFRFDGESFESVRKEGPWH